MPTCIDCENYLGDEQRRDINRSAIYPEDENSCTTYQQSSVTLAGKLMKHTIQEEIADTEWGNDWQSRESNIQSEIQKLKPTRPKDGSVGFISFDVPNKARMKLKTQRFLTRKLNLNNNYLPDHVISSIANKINSKLFPDTKIELISGEKITEAYRKAIGSSSCMTGSSCGCTRLYEMNPDRIQMLTVFYMNDSARAIVYKLDNGKHYLDRVYGSCPLVRNKAENYADKNDWYKRDNLSDLTSEQKDNLVISGLTYEEGCVPYMDTFGGSIKNGKLTLSYRNYDFDLETQTGYIDGGYTCYACGENIYEDDTRAVGDEYYCSDCFFKHFISCEYCGEPESVDNYIRIVDTEQCYCQNCAERRAWQCEDCNDWFSNNAEKHPTSDGSICENCVGDYNYCEKCEEYHRESSYPVDEGEFCVCEYCAKDHYKQCSDCEGWFSPENIDADGYCEDCKPEKDEGLSE